MIFKIKYLLWKCTDIF